MVFLIWSYYWVSVCTVCSRLGVWELKSLMLDATAPESLYIRISKYSNLGIEIVTCIVAIQDRFHNIFEYTKALNQKKIEIC